MSDSIEWTGNLLAVNGRTRIATLIEEAPSEAAIAGSKNTLYAESITRERSSGSTQDHQTLENDVWRDAREEGDAQAVVIRLAPSQM